MEKNSYTQLCYMQIAHHQETNAKTCAQTTPTYSIAGGTKNFSLGFNVVLALKKVNNIVTINLNTGLTLLFVKVSEISSEFNLWLYFQSHFRVHFKDPTPSSVPKIYENSPPFVSELLECACVIYPCHYSFVFLCTHRTTLQPNGLIRTPLRIERMANIIPYPFL